MFAKIKNILDQKTKAIQRRKQNKAKEKDYDYQNSEY